MSDYYSVLRAEVFSLLPKKFGTVMDIGCGSGTTLKWVKDRYPDSRIVGVEMNPIAAQSAREKGIEVHAVNIEDKTAPLAQFDGSVDVLFLLDILEHLQDPWGGLARFSKFLSPSGVVIASIPNVRNFKVTLPLVLRGQWTYQEAGILDRTHIRFFTRSSVEDFFDIAGYKISYLGATGPVTLKGIKSRVGLMAYVSNLMFFNMLHDFIAHQFLIAARLKRS